LQKLRSHGKRDNSGLLGANALATSDPDRAHQLPGLLRLQPTSLQATQDPGSLGGRADHANPPEIVASQGLGRDFFVEVMAMRCDHHQVALLRAGNQLVWFLALVQLHLRKQGRWLRLCIGPGIESLARIDPVDPAGHRRQDPYQGPAHMPGAMQLQAKALRGGRPGFEHRGIERPPRKLHRSAAALAQRGTEGEATPQLRCGDKGLPAAQERTRLEDHLVLEMPSANRSTRIVGRNEHPCASFTRHRPAHLQEFNQHCRPFLAQPTQRIGAGCAH